MSTAASQTARAQRAARRRATVEAQNATAPEPAANPQAVEQADAANRAARAEQNRQIINQARNDAERNLQYQTVRRGEVLAREFTVPFPFNRIFETSSVSVEGDVGSVVETALDPPGLNILTGKIEGISTSRIPRPHRRYNVVRFGQTPAVEVGNDNDDLLEEERLPRVERSIRRNSDDRNLTEAEKRENHTYMLAQGDVQFSDARFGWVYRNLDLARVAFRVLLTVCRWWLVCCNFIPVNAAVPFRDNVVLRISLSILWMICDPAAMARRSGNRGAFLNASKAFGLVAFDALVQASVDSVKLHRAVFNWFPLWSWIILDLATTHANIYSPPSCPGASTLWSFVGLGIDPVAISMKIAFNQWFLYRNLSSRPLPETAEEYFGTNESNSNPKSIVEPSPVPRTVGLNGSTLFTVMEGSSLPNSKAVFDRSIRRISNRILHILWRTPRNFGFSSHSPPPLTVWAFSHAAKQISREAVNFFQRTLRMISFPRNITEWNLGDAHKTTGLGRAAEIEAELAAGGIWE